MIKSYVINSQTGRIMAISSLDDLAVKADGSEPFSSAETAMLYRYDFDANSWVKDPIVTVPESITRYQGVLLLYRRGQLEGLKSKIAAIGGEAELAFYNSITWERNNAFVNGIASLLNMTPIDIDNFFSEASIL